MYFNVSEQSHVSVRIEEAFQRYTQKKTHTFLSKKEIFIYRSGIAPGNKKYIEEYHNYIEEYHMAKKQNRNAKMQKICKKRPTKLFHRSRVRHERFCAFEMA